MKRRNFRNCFGCVLFSVVLVVGCGGRVVLAGVPWEEVGKIVADDGTIGDQFGYSVAISDNLAVIGASEDDELGLRSGSAYVVDATTGQQLFKLLASNGGEKDYFGISVATDGHLAVVGAIFGDGNVADTGAAYVFDVTTGDELFKLVASDGDVGDHFGSSVAIAGDRIVIGASYGDGGVIDSGTAYVFDAITGQPLFKLSASDGSAGDQFGKSVAVDENRLLIGAYQDDDNGTDSGSAYIFDLSTGQQLFKLVASDGIESDRFGWSVSLSGGHGLVGSWGSDAKGTDSGAAYVFDVMTGQQVLKLSATDGQVGARFGYSVAMSGDLAVIDAQLDFDHSGYTGAAYIFDVTTGQQISKITATDGGGGKGIGRCVAISGEVVLAGAEGDDTNGTSSGAVYVFEPRDTNYLSVEPFPLVGGDDGVFSFVGGVPDAMSWLLYSVDGLGSTFIKPLNVTVDLVNPRVAVGPGLTDGDGKREVVRMLPSVAEAMDVWFQVVQHGNVTNFFRTEVLP